MMRYQIGKFLRWMGFTLIPSWKVKRGTLHLLHLAVSGFQAREGRLPVIIQIGAYDGVELDPVRDLIAQSGRVVLVEPQPAAAEKLRALYGQSGAHHQRVQVVEAAVSSSDGKVLLYADSHLSSKASLDIGHLKRFRRRSTISYEVAALSPMSLMRQCGIESVDVLQIDTEGADWRILKLFFDAGVRPVVVNFENFHLDRFEREESRSKLAAEGYSWFEHGLDTLAIRKDFIERV